MDENEGMNAYIPRYNESSPRTQSEMLTDYLINEFTIKNIQPIRIFSMADQRRSNSVKFSVILDAMSKMMPHFTKDFLDNIPYAFQMSPDDMLSREEYEMLFDTKAKMSGNAGPKQSALKKKNQMQKGASSDSQAIVKYLGEVLEKEGITAARLFKQADKNFNQVLTVDELKEQVKISLPDHFAGLNFKKLLKAFDASGNGLIEQDEFVGMVERAMNSSADTGQYSKISGALKPPGKAKGAVQKPKEGGASVTMVDTVRPEDRLKASEVIEHLKGLAQCENRVQDPIDDIQAIFQKIQAWKEKAGNSDEQEKMVAKRLKHKDKLKIHNVKTIFQVLNGLKDEIGFSDDDLRIIVFTSIDHEWFTNLLILQGEFLKWFNLNFAGESREELDFLENKHDVWAATTTLAMEVISWYGRLKENHEVVLTPQWWSHLRYFHFGAEMKDKFESNPQLMTEMRAMFKAQDDRLSYYDLFQFIQHKLEIKLETWEEDALEGRLDRLGMAFIEFNEFNEFSIDYGLKWGEPLLETDLEDILDAKNNLSYKDYVVTESDYFMGCPTMFTNEKAALAYTRKTYKQLKKEKKENFIDPYFGPKDKTDTQGHKFSLYKTGEPGVKGMKDPSEIEWVFAEELCDPGEKPQFVDDGVASDDCVQGQIGDCWLISAMSVLATRDELLIGGRRGMEYDPDMIVDKEIATLLCNGVYPPVFHKYRTKGLFVLRIFKNFQWIYVVIDERVPVYNKEEELGSGKFFKWPIFGACKDPHEMWVALIEKAYAKMHGCYENLISGYVDEGILELTALQPEKILIRNEKTGCFPHKMIEQHYGGKDGFWGFILSRDQDGCLLGCSIKGEKGGPQIIEGKPSGLIVNHAYGLNDVIELDDPFDKNRPLRLLRLRNPWGNSEWLGAWSDGSPEMEKYRPTIQKYIESLAIDEQFELGADDGTFMMHYSDWKENFSTLFVNIDFPEDWTGVRFKSAWTESNSGGLPTTYTKDVLERYAKNPQFLIKPAEDCDLMCSMSQTGGRLPVDGEYFKYPFAETLLYACVAVFQLPFGKRYLEAFDKNALRYLSPIKRERENAGRCALKGGETYVIIPSTELQGMTGDVYMSIYFNLAMRDVEVKRVFHPLDKNEAKDAVLPYFIPEEAEKLAGNAPAWKLELVREMLPYMMTDEDAGGAPESSDG